MTELQELTKWLVSADTAMVAVTFIVVQLIKAMLPSPIPRDINAPIDRWDVVKQLQWVPFVSAFIIGTLLSVLFDPDSNELIVSKFRAGLQTGALSVVVWETYSTGIKPIIEKVMGR